MFVLLFAALKVAGQTTGYLRFDTVRIMKQNGTCELYLINKTKDSLGLLTNVGGGLTQFRKSKMLNDSTIIIGLDTLVIPGSGGNQNLQQVLNNGSTLTENENIVLADSLQFTSGWVIIDSLRLRSLPLKTDTTTHKPIAIDGSGNVVKFGSWPGGGGTLQTLTTAGNTTTNDVFIQAANQITANKIYWFGNSNMVGYLLDSTTERFSTVVSRMLSCVERNKGLSGSTMMKRVPVDPFGAINMLDRLSEIPFKGDSVRYIAVMYGTNDIRQNTANYTSTNFKTDYQVFIDTCIARGFTGQDIILISPPYTTNKAYYNDSIIFGWSSQVTQARALDFASKVQELSVTYNTKLVNGYNTIYDNGRNYLFQYDSLHYNYQGHLALAAAVLDVANVVQKKTQSFAVSGVTELDTLKIASPAIATNTFLPLVTNDSGYVSTTANGLIYNIPDIANPILYRVQGGNIAMSGKIIAGGANYANETEDIIAQSGVKINTGQFNGDIFGNKNTNAVRLRRNSTDYIVFNGTSGIAMINSTASGDYSFSQGFGASATGVYDIALGALSQASGNNSIALQGGRSVGQFSFSSGFGYSDGAYSFSHGEQAYAGGRGSLSIGAGDTTAGQYSQSLGYNIRSASFAQASLGMWNIKRTANSTSGWHADDIACVVGVGRDVNNQRDGFAVYKNGISKFDTSAYYNAGKTPTALTSADSLHILALKHFNKLITDTLNARGVGGSSITSINSMTGPAITVTTGTGLTSSSGSNSVTISVDVNSTDIHQVLNKQFTDVNNSGTSETDLYTYTLGANKLINNGASINFEMAGVFNDASATVNLQAYFGGNSIAGAGLLTISGTGAWSIHGTIIRTGTTTARAYTVMSIDNSTNKIYSTMALLTGLDFTTTNIVKVTGTAGGAGGGTNDITGQMWIVKFEP